MDSGRWVAQTGHRHARFGQLPRKGMPKLVRRQVDPGLPAIAVQQPLNPVGAQRLPTLVQKNIPGFVLRTPCEPVFQNCVGIRRQPDHPFLAPLPTHPQPGHLFSFWLTDHVTQFHVHDFSHAQPAPYHQSKPCSIPGRSDHTPHLFDVFVTYVPRQTARTLASVTLEMYRIGPTQVVALFGQKVEERFQRRHATIDRG